MNKELWDLYDKDGNRTGEIWERRHGNYRNIPDGRYHLVSDILVQHTDGTFLLTKRDINKDVYPGYWEASAGGSAQTGESPEECAKRELFEETGLICDSFEVINKTFSERSHSLVYSFLAIVSGDKNAVVLQDGETTGYKWVSSAGLLEYAESESAIKTSVERYKKFYDKVRLSLESEKDIMNIEYRKARSDEAERVCYIVQHTKEVIYPDYYTKAVMDFFGSLHSIDNIKKDIEKNRISVLVADDEIIGTGSHTDDHITRVYVLPEYQGQGFGSRIMNELEKEIFANYRSCVLEASLPACIFYENRGYKTVRHVKEDIGGGKCMIYEIMRKEKE